MSNKNPTINDVPIRIIDHTNLSNMFQYYEFIRKLLTMQPRDNHIVHKYAR